MKKSRRNIRRKTRKKRRYRRRRRYRGGVNIGATAKKTMTSKSTSAMGRFGSRRRGRKNEKRSHLTKRPPKKSPPPPPSNKSKRSATVKVSKKNILKTKHDTDSIEKAEPAHKVGVSISKITTKADSKTPAYWCGDSGLTPALKKKGNCSPSKKKIVCKNLKAFCKTKPKSSFCNKCPKTHKSGGRRKYKSRKKHYRRR